MATSQYFIYDTDGGGFNAQTFIVGANNPKMIRSAGLTDDVMIYQMVGTCNNCKPEDVIWEPVMQCGSPLILGPDNNSVIVTLPGTYSVGDPITPPVFAGDVNITGEDLKGVDPSLLGKCADGAADSTLPSDVTIINDCTAPVLVEMCPGSLGIETSITDLGCIFDINGDVEGKVVLCKTVDEETGAESVRLDAYYTDGTNVQNYAGPWGVCSTPEEPCEPEAFLGVITDTADLDN